MVKNLLELGTGRSKFLSISVNLAHRGVAIAEGVVKYVSKKLLQNKGFFVFAMLTPLPPPFQTFPKPLQSVAPPSPRVYYIYIYLYI